MNDLSLGFDSSRPFFRMTARFAPSKGDWICGDPKCENINFSKRESCNRCGSKKKHGRPADARMEIGKDVAEKSKGLFSPEDWSCRSCGNINWARRSTCNVCNSSKVNTLGERTGYGGGFMERDEVVEYKRRDDSEDEFDEFGRKKKRFRRLTTDGLDTNEANGREAVEVQTKVKDVQKVTVPPEDDEEEESGDDADLSKYDVWGQDNEDASSAHSLEKNSDKSVENETTPNSPKRSRANSLSSSSTSSESDTSTTSSSSSTSSNSRSGSSRHSRFHSKKSSGVIPPAKKRKRESSDSEPSESRASHRRQPRNDEDDSNSAVGQDFDL